MTEKSAKIIIVFVHGWSVTDTSTYGELPQRLRREAGAAGLVLQLTDIFLGRYISFHDEVRLCDISRAFHAALRDQLGNALANGERFVCITRSTGGPVLRDRWDHYYQKNPANGTYPMSHLIMLAPANYGSALAQLGKQRIGRLKSWFAGVEPAKGVLDWLELDIMPIVRDSPDDRASTATLKAILARISALTTGLPSALPAICQRDPEGTSHRIDITEGPVTQLCSAIQTVARIVPL